MSPPPSDLRPLAIGEIIDRSATFWRRHFRPLFLLSLGFNLATYILTKVLQLTLQDTLVLQTRGGDLEELGASLLRTLVSLGGVFLVSLWLYYLNTLVVARYVVPTQLGDEAAPATSLGRAWKRLGALTGAYVLSLLWGTGVLLLMMLPGGLMLGGGGVLVAQAGRGAPQLAGAALLIGGVIVVSLGFVGALLWYLLRFSLLAPVLAMEDLSAARSFRRSGELLSGRVEPGFIGRVTVRAMLLVTVVSLILLAVSALFGLPALVVQFAYRDPSQPLLSPAPQALLIPAELLQVVGQAVLNPLGLVVYAMLYLDMRVRREGLDIERRLDAAPPSPAQPVGAA
ncbi:putative integral membrane protein [Cystobacter fuscus DSM 2262]|uniref:Integral membrane protein n=1 Tax=Cystobacter fuscus (strain ATCC 25194 / DSM 2262 / NBRC 100088 / M29) TaxID=1242864 RepID=S9NYU0_CYSF2|nr:hypothetical protein [Cystobacter fuscus]EPX57395.1 putative integral membrane protein [Cystobacter fuscus DSM 2262]